MNNRQLWVDTMHYRPVDRAPVMHWATWEETHREWEQQGMPANETDLCGFLGVSPIQHFIGSEMGLFPPFEEETIEETPDYRVVRQHNGVIARFRNGGTAVPQQVGHTLKSDGQGWAEYKKRLQPDPGRIYPDMEVRIRKAGECTNAPVTTYIGSLVGWIRDWMGIEEFAYLCADNLDLFQEIVDTLVKLGMWNLEYILPRVKIDACMGWEDICFRSGPLINPELFKRFCVPGYQRFSGKLAEYGVNLFAVDCDGKIDDLIPHWLDGGVNVMFPFELGPWNPDPAEYRKRFGKNLRIFGGIDKMELLKGREAIDAEIARRIPMMKAGGFVPLPDHFIMPGTSLADYQYYLRQLGSVRWNA